LNTSVAPDPIAKRRLGRVLTYRRFAVVSLLFPPFGILALTFSIRAGRLARQGSVEAARIKGERARDWAWYSIGYGLLVYFFGLVAYILFANHGAVRTVFFGWSTLTSWISWHSLLKGFWINVQVFLWAQALVLVWALVVAVVRLLPGKACAPIRFVAIAYCDAFRAIPGLLVIYLIGYGLPQAKLPFLRDFSDIQFSVLALVLVYGAYVSEVYRAGIESIHWSQVAASRSLGLTYAQTLRHVVVPQAIRRVRPPLLNDAIGLQKDTALISFIGVLDVISRARFISNSRATLTGYTMAAMLFAALSLPMTRYLDRVIKRDKLRMLVG
jgi:polar amino acid transport system permease protein